MRTVSYAKCHRCGNANDRGSQRTCKSCHAIIQQEHRAKKARKLEQLQARVFELEDENAALRLQLVAFRASLEVPREMERAA